MCSVAAYSGYGDVVNGCDRGGVVAVAVTAVVAADYVVAVDSGSSGGGGAQYLLGIKRCHRRSENRTT